MIARIQPYWDFLQQVRWNFAEYAAESVLNCRIQTISLTPKNAKFLRSNLILTLNRVQMKVTYIHTHILRRLFLCWTIYRHKDYLAPDAVEAEKLSHTFCNDKVKVYFAVHCKPETKTRRASSGACIYYGEKNEMNNCFEMSSRGKLKQGEAQLIG